MHTAEHILNRAMVNMFGCPRSRNAHIERKKSKCDYIMDTCPTDEQVYREHCKTCGTRMTCNGCTSCDACE